MGRRHIAYAAAAALLASLAAGCSADMGDPQKDEVAGTGSISLSISDPSGSRTILPSGVTGPAPSAYLVGGTGPDGEDLTKGKATAAGSELATVSWKDPFGGDAERTWFVTDKTALDVKGVHQGEWDLRVVSMYDALGEDETFAEGASRIAKGQTIKRLSAAGASATVALDRLVRGDEGGTLPAGQTARISLTWDKDQVETPVLTVKAKYQGDGTKDSAAATFAEWFSLGLSSGNNTGEKEFTTKALPAGAYTVLASITEKKADGTYDTLAGTADVVRILENRQSAGTIPLTIGLVTNEYTLALKDMTMRPIEGEIIVSGSSAVWYPDEDSFNALASTGLITVPDGKTYGTMTKDEIDQVLDASNLTYLWTIDGQGTVEGGQQVEAAGNNVSWSGVATGEAALQVVVGSGLLGSLGSTGVTITPGMIEFRWPDDVLAETGEAAAKAFVGYRKIGAGKALDAKATVASLVSFPYIGSWDDLEPVYVPVDELFDAWDKSTPVFYVMKDEYVDISVLSLPPGMTTINAVIGDPGFPEIASGPQKIHLPSSVKEIGALMTMASEINLEGVSRISVLYAPNMKEADLSSLDFAGIPEGTTELGLYYNCRAISDACTRITLGPTTNVILNGNVSSIALYGNQTRPVKIPSAIDLDGIESFTMDGIEIDELSLPSAREAGIRNSRIGSLYAPNIETFTMDGIEIDELNLPSARKAGISNSIIGSLYAPNLETADDGFLYRCEVLAAEVDLPSLVSVGEDAFARSTFKRLSLDSLTTIGSSFMNKTHVDELYLPSLASAEGTGNVSVFQGLKAGKIVAPKIKKLSYAFDSATLGDVDLPALETLGDHAFHACVIGTLRMKRLTTIEGSFNFENINLEGTLALPSLKTISGNYNFYGLHAASASMPLLESVTGKILGGTEIGNLYLPETLKTVGQYAIGMYWTSSQTIHVPFAEGKLPSGWASDWLDTSCKAKVVYGDVDGSAL